MRDKPRSGARFDAVKVFSATMAEPRQALGETVSAWLGANPTIEIVDVVVSQSSDARFHCLSIVLFYVTPPPRRSRRS